MLGWYNITADGTPTRADVGIHAQVIESDAGPGLFVVFDPAIPAGAKALPFAVYESALEAALEGEAKAADAGAAGGMFIQLECGIETGEAERIAVEGVTKEVGADGDETGRAYKISIAWLELSLTTQKSRPSPCSATLLP